MFWSGERAETGRIDPLMCQLFGSMAVASYAVTEVWTFVIKNKKIHIYIYIDLIVFLIMIFHLY